jgi:hypothetical protein
MGPPADRVAAYLIQRTNGNVSVAQLSCPARLLNIDHQCQLQPDIGDRPDSIAVTRSARIRKLKLGGSHCLFSGSHCRSCFSLRRSLVARKPLVLPLGL